MWWWCAAAAATAGVLWLWIDWSIYVTITTVACTLRSSSDDPVIIAAVGTQMYVWTRETMPQVTFDELDCKLFGRKPTRVSPDGPIVVPAATHDEFIRAITHTKPLLHRDRTGKLLVLADRVYLVVRDTVQVRRIPPPGTP